MSNTYRGAQLVDQAPNHADVDAERITMNANTSVAIAPRSNGSRFLIQVESGEIRIRAGDNIIAGATNGRIVGEGYEIAYRVRVSVYSVPGAVLTVVYE